jgi:Regulator of ribonuclease activity B
MKQEMSKAIRPEPTSNQLLRAEHLLEKFAGLVDLGNFHSYSNAFLQVLSDIATIDKLLELGINVDHKFLIHHVATFQTLSDAQKFVRLTNCSGYAVDSVGKQIVEDCYEVVFVHSGTFELDDILIHTMSLDKAALDMNGKYEGWEVVMDCTPSPTKR